MFCIIWKINGEWSLFTNEIWLIEKEALEYAKRNNFKKNVEWKVDDYKNWFKPNV